MMAMEMTLLEKNLVPKDLDGVGVGGREGLSIWGWRQEGVAS